jgi:hypothetical protein
VADGKIHRGGLAPKSLAPFFVLTAGFHLACLITRFDEIAQRLPEGVAAGLLFATFPLLLVEGYFESRIDYGQSLEGMPLWMQIRSGPVKAAFTLAFTYLAVVVLQTFDIEIGPIDPTPPPEWPLQQRAMWFGIMSVGMFFPNYLATTSLLVPALRALGRIGQKVMAPLAVALLALLGAGLGCGAVALLHSQMAHDEVSSAQGIWESFTSEPLVAIGVAFAGLAIPAIVGLVLTRLRGEPED